MRKKGKLKILLVIDNLGSGGAQNQLSLFAVELVKRGLEVEVFTYYPHDFFKNRLLEFNIPCHLILKRGKLGINVVRGLVKLINKNSYDHIFSVLDTPNFYSTLATKLSSHKPKLIISYLSKSDFGRMSFLEIKRKEWINKNVHHIIANSHHERKRWVARYPKLNSKFTTIYNFVDLDHFKFKERKKRTFKLLCVGSPSPYKNGLCVIDALSYLNEHSNLQIKITWIGEKQMHIKERREYIEMMEKRIKQHELNGSWVWKKPTRKILDEYHAHDSMILASTTEGLPNVICEAQATGIPVFASNILDHPQLLQDGKIGYLFDPNKPEDLARHVIGFYDSADDNYRALQSASRKFAEEAYKKENLIPKYLEIFRKISSQN